MLKSPLMKSHSSIFIIVGSYRLYAVEARFDRRKHTYESLKRSYVKPVVIAKPVPLIKPSNFKDKTFSEIIGGSKGLGVQAVEANVKEYRKRISKENLVYSIRYWGNPRLWEDG
ncbi:hypothetical protein L1987_27792 [Smallanthus sonchifolius]|uniref:Uncharacterized protein n=1 Tax=Smallanthus sonchifolius TaxID=185202 RepID=A0ACB9ID76_9ASTR|nr:hypothetical protein L1987_27792 [Smallanthus sonchifolius]